VAEIVCFLLSVFWKPTIGLYLLIPFLPLQTIRYRIHGYFLGAQFIDLLLLGVILGLKRQGRPIFPKTPLTGLLFTYVVFTYLSMLRGSFFLGRELPLWFDDQRLSDWKNYVVVLPMVFLVTFNAIRTKRQMRILLFAMCVGLLLLAKSVNNTITDRDFSSFSYDLRTEAAVGNAGVNGLAALEAEAAIFLVALCLIERRFLMKSGYLGVAVACVYALMFTLSRGGYAAFLAGIAYLGFVRNRTLLVALGLFLLVWQGVVPPAVRERILMTTNEQGIIDHSAEARLSLWEEAMTVFEADPIFGVGFNTYAYGSHVGGYGDTHNVFVKVLVETGLTGLVLFLAILRKLFQIGFKLYRTASDPFLQSIGLGLSGLMVAALIANLFGDRWMYFQITGYTYAFTALAVRAQQMEEEAETDEPAMDTAELVAATV